MRRLTESLGWLSSSALLLAIPKCPGCITAYVAIWTGLGLSITTASYLRTAAIALAVAAMGFLVFYRINRLRRNRSAASPAPFNR